MKYFVHDFLFENTNVKNNKDCFFYHITVFCSQNRKSIKSELEEFGISVGNIFGISEHLKILQTVFKESKETSFFDGPFMIIDNYNEEEIMKILREKIESITGSNERELLYNLSPYFQWEYLSDPSVVRGIFK